VAGHQNSHTLLADRPGEHSTLRCPNPISNAALSPPGRFLYVDRDAFTEGLVSRQDSQREAAGIAYVTTMPIVSGNVIS